MIVGWRASAVAARHKHGAAHGQGGGNNFVLASNDDGDGDRPLSAVHRSRRRLGERRDERRNPGDGN
jgi:hypothetical protein